MQRNIQDFQELLSEFNDLQEDILKQIDAFSSSVKSGFSESNIHTPLLAPKQASDKEKESVTVLAGWFVPTTITVLQQATEAYAQFYDLIQREFVARKKFQDVLKNVDYTLEEKFENEVNNCKNFISDSKSKAQKLIDEMHRLIHVVHPNLTSLISELYTIVPEITQKLSLFAAKTATLREKRQDTENMINLVGNIPPLKTLTSIPQLDKLYRNLAKLLEGSEWATDWNRCDPLQVEVENFLPKWQKLVPVINERKKILEVQESEYKAVDWPLRQRSYGHTHAERERLLAHVDFTTFNTQLVSLIKPLLSKTNALTTVKKQQQVAQVKKAFDDIIRELSTQSEHIAFHIKSIDIQIADILTEPTSVALGGQDLALIEAMKGLHEGYRWRMEFATKTMKKKAAQYSDEHLKSLLDVLKHVVTPEIYAQLFFDATGTKNPLVIANAHVLLERSESEAILKLGMVFLEKQKAIFEQEFKKIKATNQEVMTTLEELNQYDSLRRAEILLGNSLQLQTFADRHDPVIVGQTLSELKKNVLESTNNIKSKWFERSTEEWELPFEGTIYQSNQAAIPRQTELRKNVALINDTFKHITNFSLAISGRSKQYHNFAEKYNALMTVVQKIVAASDNLLAEDALLLKNYMIVFEEEMQARMSKTRAMLRERMDGACKRMDGDIEVVAASPVRLKELVPLIPDFSTTFQALGHLKEAFQRLSATKQESYQSLTAQFQDLSAPLDIIPVSLNELQTHWLYGAVAYFQRSYAAFEQAENERQEYVKESENWAAMMRPNFRLLAEAHILWESVSLVESQVKEVGANHQNRSKFFLNALSEMKAQFEVKEKSNQRIKLLVENLQLTIMEQLNSLDSANPYNLAMVELILNDSLRDDAEVWQKLDQEKKQLDWLLGKKAYIQKSKMDFAELDGELQEFNSLTNNGITADTNIINEVLTNISLFNSFKQNGELRKSENIKKINTEIVKIRSSFYKTKAQHLMPIEAFKITIIQKEQELHKSFKIAKKQLKSFAVDVKKLTDLLGRRTDDIRIVPGLTLDIALSEKLALEPTIETLMRSVSERITLNEPEVEIVRFPIKPFKVDQFKQAIASQMKDFNDPVVLLTATKTQLNAEKESIDKIIAQGNRQNALQNRDMRDLVLLKDERDRLRDIQNKSTQALLKLVPLLLSENSYVTVCEQGEEPMQVLSLTTILVKEIINDFHKIKQETEKLHALKPKLLVIRGNAYTAPLETLAEMTKLMLDNLQACVAPLRKSWSASLLAYKQLPFLNDGNVVSKLLMRLLAMLKLSFIDLGQVENLNEVVGFDSNESENYAKLKALTHSFLNRSKLIADNPTFLSGFAEAFAEPINQHWADEEAILRSFYQIEMQQVIELYQWLLTTHARIVSFEKLAEMKHKVSHKKIVQLNDWIDQAALPFLNAYNLLLSRKKQITALDAVIEKLEQKVRFATSQPLASLQRESRTIEEQLSAIKLLSPSILKRAGQIEELKSNKEELAKARESFSADNQAMLVNVCKKVFERFRYCFFAHKDTKEIMAELRRRANKNKIKKPLSDEAITTFIQSLDNCHTNLYDFVLIIQDPLKDGCLGKNKVSLTRTRGGPTETHQLIERLNVVLIQLIADQHTQLFFKDIENEFAKREELFRSDAFLNADAAEEIFFNFSYFDFFSQELKDEIANNVITKQTDVLSNLNESLDKIKTSSDNDLTKLMNLKTLLEKECKVINESLKGEIRLFFGSGSKLAAKLQEQIGKLRQILATYPTVESTPGLAHR